MGYIAIVSPLYHLLVPCLSYKFIPPYPWKSCMISPRNREHVWLNTVDGCEILHHQKGGWNRNKMMGCLPPINWWFAFRWPIHRIATITNFPIILPSFSHHCPIILPSFSHHSPIIFAWRFAWGQECSLMTVKTYMLLSGVLVLRREKVPELVLGRGVPRYICGLNQQESMVEPTEPWDSRPENQREFLLQQRWWECDGTFSGRLSTIWIQPTLYWDFSGRNGITQV